MTPIIECKQIDFSYSEKRRILTKVSLEINEGQLITLLGPNGAGKSTLLNCVCGVLYPQQGTLKLMGRDIRKISPRERAKYIAYVPQKTAVSFDYSVRDFVVMGRTAHLNVLAMPSNLDYKKTDEALSKLGISSLSSYPISELSGGEQQKACIARAIVQDPKLVVLDEPTSALDYGNQIKVLNLVKELSELGYAILMTTHNPDHCLMLNGNVALIDKSGHMTIGTCDSILTENNLEDVYNTKIKLLYIEGINRKICVPSGLQ